MKFNLICLIAAFAACVTLQASDGNKTIRVTAADGNVQGQIFAMIGEEKAPLVGKIALTDKDGKALATSQSDENGKFSFEDVKPGNYKAVGIAGDYVGHTDVQVLESEDVDSELFAAIPLPVAPAAAPQMYEAYAGLPAVQFSSAPARTTTSQSYIIRSAGGTSAPVRGGFNFRRLAIIGAAAAIPIALSGGDDDPATPDGS